MAFDRPSFSESWHRVAQMTPRLRADVQVSRQRFRGNTWHVLRDGAGGAFHRIDESGYRFLGLLDGQRTVDDAWTHCEERYGDDAPTQPEALELLGRLASAHLLAGDAGGAAGAIQRRRSRRVETETRSRLMNFLFLRLPLFDPDSLLTRWLPMAAWLVSPVGLVLMLLIWGAGGLALAPRLDELDAGFRNALSADNLPLLYLSFVLIKGVHELAHGFACKAYGRRFGGGEVHTIGIMLLVFMPVPYVDASSSWAFPRRRPRVVVASAGVLVEITIAALCAMVWAASEEGVVRALAYNAMFIAGVSSVLFNANPLLRYDGYYILSDLLDIPNLWSRSRDYLLYLIKTRLLGVRRLPDPAHTTGERWWFVVYWIASMTYRVFLYAAIVWFLSERFFMLGLLLAVGAVVVFLVVPLARGVRYLLTSHELARTRPRALLVSGGAAAALGALLGLVPAPDYVRAEGVAEPERLSVIYAGTGGFAADLPAQWADGVREGEVLAVLEHDETLAAIAEVDANIRRTEARRRLALRDDPAAAAALAQQGDALLQRRARLTRDRDQFVVRAPEEGVWASPGLSREPGRWVDRGEKLGVVANTGSMFVRAVAPQAIAALVLEESRTEAEMRVRGNPQRLIAASVSREDIRPAGQRRLPSASLGYAAGGLTPIDPGADDPSMASERFFEARVLPEPGSGLLPGQRVIVRFRLDDRPLASQWWRWLRQTVQSRLDL